MSPEPVTREASEEWAKRWARTVVALSDAVDVETLRANAWEAAAGVRDAVIRRLLDGRRPGTTGPSRKPCWWSTTAPPEPMSDAEAAVLASLNGGTG